MISSIDTPMTTVIVSALKLRFANPTTENSQFIIILGATVSSLEKTEHKLNSLRNKLGILIIATKS
jgi:hypothetical protein